MFSQELLDEIARRAREEEAREIAYRAARPWLRPWFWLKDWVGTVRWYLSAWIGGY